MYVNVAAGFSLRFLSSDEFMTISRKLRNLKVAATKIAQFRYQFYFGLTYCVPRA